MQSELLKPEIRDALEGRRWSDLRRMLVEQPAPEVAELLLEVEKGSRVLLFRLLPRDLAAEVFSHLAFERATALLHELTDEESRRLLADLPPDDRTALLEELPAAVTRRMLNLLGPEDLKEARQLLGYPEESVGRLMTPDYVAVRPNWTVGEAIDHIRARGQDSETVNVVYVTDAAWRLLDELPLRRLILAASDATVASLMDETYVSVVAFADREEAVRLIQRYDVVALPVVDSNGLLVGIVTVDDVLDVVEEETTEDFHKLGIVEPIHMSLRDATAALLFRRRIGWLLVLVAVNIFSGQMIAFFEETIIAVTALVFFLPLFMGSGGNAGSQAATLMVRALATGDVKAAEWFRFLGRELGVAAMLGASMAVAVSLLGLYRGGPQLALVVASTMLLVVILGSVIGMSLPFVLARFRLDPATASAPLITSVADIVGVLTYFSIARWYLGV